MRPKVQEKVTDEENVEEQMVVESDNEEAVPPKRTAHCWQFTNAPSVKQYLITLNLLSNYSAGAAINNLSCLNLSVLGKSRTVLIVKYYTHTNNSIIM